MSKRKKKVGIENILKTHNNKLQWYQELTSFLKIRKFDKNDANNSRELSKYFVIKRSLLSGHI